MKLLIIILTLSTSLITYTHAKSHIEQQKDNCTVDVMIETGLEIPMQIAEAYCGCVMHELSKLNQPLDWEKQKKDRVIVIPIKKKCKL